MIATLLCATSLSLTAPSDAATITLDGTVTVEKFERSGYFNMGLAPSTTFRFDGFAPGQRYDVETGFQWKRRHVRLSVGAEAHLLHFYGRRKPAGGVDAMITASYRMLYIRGGLGTMANLPATRDLDRGLPAVGGVIGVGLQTWGDHVGGRIGVDYDFRVDTAGRPIQTVLLSLRIMFG